VGELLKYVTENDNNVKYMQQKELRELIEFSPTSLAYFLDNAVSRIYKKVPYFGLIEGRCP
jgi:hypothetical protein